MRPGTGRWLAFLCALFSIQTHGELFEPSPSGGAHAGGAPFLSWAPSTNSLLSNGGFEQGLEGWSASPRATVVSSNASIKPLEGAKALRMDYARVSRQIEVPTGAPVALTFAVNPPGASGVTIARILNDRNEVVQERYLPMQGGLTLNGTWPRFHFDLTPFAGQSVKFELTTETGDYGVYRYFDDFRLVTTDPGTEYDVYLSAPRSQVLKYVGRTRGTSWSLTNLSPDSVYDWRVDSISNGVTNQGPVWRFFTDSRDTISYLTINQPAQRVCAQRPLDLTVFKMSRLSLPSNTGGLPQFTAFADDLKEPSVVISEISWGAQNGIELVNVSTGRVSLAKWRIDAYGRIFSGLDTFSPQVITIPDGTALDPGQILTIAETNRSLRLQPIDWADVSTRLVATVIMRDAASNLVDSVFINAPPSRMTDEPRLVVSDYDWIGPRIEVAAENTTLQRIGSRDSNRASDWVSAPGTFGSPNAELASVFERGPGRLPLLSSQATNENGVTRAKVEFAGPATNVILAGKWFNAVGFTAPFNVVGAERCMTLIAPTELVEADTTGTKLKIILGAPDEQDVVVRLRSADPRRLPLPETLTIPAGATELEIDFRAPNDELLEGATSVTIMADADAYSSADAEVIVRDDEKAELSIIAPATVQEGTSGEIYFVSSRAPDKDIFISIESSDTEIFPAYGTTLKAGQTRALLLVPSWQNSSFQSTHAVSVKASFEDWTPASAEFQYVDDEAPQVLVEALNSIREGETVTQPYVTLNMTATHDVTLTLKSSDPNFVITPTQVTIPAYMTGANFEARAIDDDLKTGRRTVTITAEGIVTGTHTVIVEDNDPDSLRVEVPPGPWAKDRDVEVIVTAMSIDDTPIPFSGITNLTLVVKEGETVLPSTRGAGSGHFGAWKTPVQIHQTTPGAKIFATSGDLKGQSQLATPVWTYVPTNSARAVYDSVRDDFIVAEFNAPLRIFDGETGEDRLGGAGLNQTFFVVLSDDKKSVFAIGGNMKRLVKIDLETLATEDWTSAAIAGETRLILSAAALPRRPELLAVYANGETNGFFMVISNGVRIAERTAPLNWNPWLAVTPDGRKAFVNSVKETFTINLDEGPTFLNFDATTQWNVNPFGVYGAPIYADGLLINPMGLAMDPEVSGFYTPTQTYFTGASMAVDEQTRRLALLHQIADGRAELRIIAPITYATIASVNFPVMTTSQVYVAPAGKRGWIALAGAFHIIPHPAAPPLEKSDIAVTAQASAHPTSSRALRVNFTISNSGDAAENVTLGLALPENIMIVGVPPGATKLTNSPLQHGYALGEIPAKSSRQFQFDFTRPNPGSIALSAFAGTGKSEDDLADNRAVALGAVTFETPPPQPPIAVNLALETAMAHITFPTTAGWLYRLQWTDGPASTWLEYPMEQRGNGEDWTFQVPVEDGVPIRFFRVVAYP